MTNFVEFGGLLLDIKTGEGKYGPYTFCTIRLPIPRRKRWGKGKDGGKGDDTPQKTISCTVVAFGKVANSINGAQPGDTVSGTGHMIRSRQRGWDDHVWELQIKAERLELESKEDDLLW